MPRLQVVPETGASDVAHRVVARTPIVGVDLEIAAFELAHRATEGAGSPNPHAADTFTFWPLVGHLSFDLHDVVGDRQVFIKPWPGLLAREAPMPLPPGSTTVEVPGSLAGDPEIVARCRELVEDGYAVAVDVRSWQPGIERLLDVAQVARLELGHAPREEVLALATRCRQHAVSLRADRCLTEADLGWAAWVGFEHFGGPAVQRPTEPDRPLAPTALGQVQLATELLDERIDFRRVEEILSHEPGLVVQVLHEASIGAAGGLRREVRSIREALVVMGTMRLRQWAAMAVLGRNMANTRTDALTVALSRAQLCALVAPTHDIDRGYAFTAGLLSALDRLLGVPISVVERRVDVDKELGAAAFQRKGRVGDLVDLAARYQDAVDDGDDGFDGSTVGTAGAERLDLAAAAAFAWAMSQINAIERASAVG